MGGFTIQLLGNSVNQSLESLVTWDAAPPVALDLRYYNV